MKKVMMVVGVAACVTLVGCKHDEYGPHKVGNKVQPVETVEVASDVEPVTVAGQETKAEPAVADTGATSVATDKPAAVTPVAPKEEQAETTVTAIPDAPAPAKDAGKDAAAKDAGKDAPKADAAKDAGKTAPAVEAEFTPYVVRGGDTLGGICNRYKVKKADVLALNPGMDPNKIFVGRTIKLPGNIEAAKSAPAPKAAVAKEAGAKKAAPAVKREYKPYTGETKEYVVKAGDTISGIAYSNGLSIRQFKELNGLTSDVIRERQKVKIPATPVKAEKPAAAAADVKKEAVEKGPKVIEAKKDEIQPVAADPAADKPAEAPAAAAVQAPAPAEAKPVVDQAAAEAVPAAAEPPADNYTTYTVKQGDDLYSVAIKWSVTASQLKEANNLLDDTLTPGQILKVPAKAE